MKFEHLIVPVLGWRDAGQLSSMCFLQSMIIFYDALPAIQPTSDRWFNQATFVCPSVTWLLLLQNFPDSPAWEITYRQWLFLIAALTFDLPLLSHESTSFQMRAACNLRFGSGKILLSGDIRKCRLLACVSQISWLFYLSTWFCLWNTKNWANSE